MDLILVHQEMMLHNRQELAKVTLKARARIVRVQVILNQSSQVEILIKQPSNLSKIAVLQINKKDKTQVNLAQKALVIALDLVIQATTNSKSLRIVVHKEVMPLDQKKLERLILKIRLRIVRVLKVMENLNPSRVQEEQRVLEVNSKLTVEVEARRILRTVVTQAVVQ